MIIYAFIRWLIAKEMILLEKNISYIKLNIKNIGNKNMNEIIKVLKDFEINNLKKASKNDFEVEKILKIENKTYVSDYTSNNNIIFKKKWNRLTDNEKLNRLHELYKQFDIDTSKFIDVLKKVIQIKDSIVYDEKNGIILKVNNILLQNNKLILIEKGIIKKY